MVGYILSVFSCLIWVFTLAYMRLSIARMPLLRDGDPDSGHRGREWPSLCVIVPACNEAANLEISLTSLLAQDYPGLQIVVVDDRSNDSTPEILRRLAAADRRIRSVRIESLPEGWLGKVHALHRGVQEAQADWYLFTDADVCFERGVLKRAIAYAGRNGVTHLTCVPEMTAPAAFWLDVTIRSFFLMFCAATRLASVNRQDSRKPVGVGAFNLVEAGVFARTPGFEWLRMEPADDLGLGAMLKAAGALTQIVHGDGMLRMSWYANVREMSRGLEKNSFGPAANYRYSRQLALVLLLWLLALMPVLSLISGLYLSDPLLIAAGGSAAVATVAVSFLMPRHRTREIFVYLLLPVGLLIMSAIMLRAAYLCLRNGGIDWRGTHYSVAELRAGQRVRF